MVRFVVRYHSKSLYFQSFSLLFRRIGKSVKKNRCRKDKKVFGRNKKMAILLKDLLGEISSAISSANYIMEETALE